MPTCPCVRRLPSRNPKRRMEARLRKLRWIIYQKICCRRKKRLSRLFEYYKKQVDVYLMKFSSKLRKFEIDIWRTKLLKTKDDVFDFLNKEQNAVASKVAAPDKGIKDAIGMVEELSKSRIAGMKRSSKLQRIVKENEEKLCRDLEKLCSVQVVHVKNEVTDSEMFTKVKKVYLEENFVIMEFIHIVKPLS